MGLHPWKIHPSHWENDLISLQNASVSPKVVAIGECGLDRSIPIELTLQSSVFRKQIHWATTLQKPLIIHCVRAWEEVFALLKEEHFLHPVLFHGFNKNLPLALKIIEKGYYISLGKALQKESLQEVLRNIPADRFLLETDDSSLSIEEIYTLAADTLQIDLNSLSLQIEKNAAAVFGPLDVIL